MFRFKQFSVADDHSSMKVGTDAVLLGAYQGRQCTLLNEGPRTARPRILDIGTGCGVIALMLAQQCAEAHIDAIDVDLPSVQQAAENFRHSPWPERLHAHLSSLQAFQAEPYDLIVSNPPYFTASLRNADPRRAQARHNDALPLDSLLQHAQRLLAHDGSLSLILPMAEAQRLEALAPAYGLHLSSALLVQNRLDLPPKRRILTFGHHAAGSGRAQPTQGTLVLTTPEGARTPAHRALTEAFYL